MAWAQWHCAVPRTQASWDFLLFIFGRWLSSSNSPHGAMEGASAAIMSPFQGESRRKRGWSSFKKTFHKLHPTTGHVPDNSHWPLVDLTHLCGPWPLSHSCMDSDLARQHLASCLRPAYLVPRLPHCCWDLRSHRVHVIPMQAWSRNADELLLHRPSYCFGQGELRAVSVNQISSSPLQSPLPVVHLPFGTGPREIK